MSGFFYQLLYRPLFNALVFLYQTIGLKDLGISIILLTVVIRLVLYPLFYKSYKNQKLLQKIQPEMKKIQHTHKDNREKQAQALMELYKQHQVSPFSGFFLILIQLPILIALYRVFFNGFSAQTLTSVYDFITAPQEINHSFLGLIDLAKPHIIIVGLAALAQYFQGWLSLPKTVSGQTLTAPERMTKQMVYMGPALTLIILYSLPAAIGLYWLVTSIFSTIQQFFINKSVNQATPNGKISIPNKTSS